MKLIDATTQAALVAAPTSGLRARDLVTFKARPIGGGAPVEFSFWNDIDTVAIQVFRGDTGSAESRTFVGDGALLKVGATTFGSDLTIQTLTITMSQLHATVQNMARGYDIRQAQVEVHRVLFDPRTNAVIGPATSRFVGKVNKAPIATPKSGEEGGIDIACVSHLREMTRTNPAKKSDETQKRRSSDRFRRHGNVADRVLFWGQESAKAGNGGQVSGGQSGYSVGKGLR